MPELVAMRSFTYATRRLKAGDSFTASPPWARALLATGQARRAEPPAIAPSSPRPPDTPPQAPRVEPPAVASSVGAMTTAQAPVKRGRGRPRKHPRPS